MSASELLAEVEEASAIEAARLVLLGKAPARLLWTYAPVPRTRCGVSLDPCEPVSSRQRRRLRERWPNAERLRAAFHLAPDLATCRALLAGEPVDLAALDSRGLAWAREARLVRLERPLDLIEGCDAV